MMRLLILILAAMVCGISYAGPFEARDGDIRFDRFMDFTGDGTGSKSATGDYSSTADEMYLTPPAGYTYFVHRIIVSARDTNGMAAEEYGNLGSALSNGIELKHVRGLSGNVVVNNITDDVPILTNAGWAERCYDADIKTWGNGVETLVVRWTFTNAGKPIQLKGNSHDRLVVYLNDNFSGLLSHRFLVEGFYRLDR